LFMIDFIVIKVKVMVENVFVKNMKTKSYNR